MSGISKRYVLTSDGRLQMGPDGWIDTSLGTSVSDAYAAAYIRFHHVSITVFRTGEDHDRYRRPGA